MSNGYGHDSHKETIYLIDGTAYIHRAYHAIRGLSNSKGLPTNAVFGFTRMLLKLLEEKKPEYIVVLFDAKGKTFRHDMYPLYKANRPAMADDMAVQIPYIKAIVEGLNIPVIELAGYEADDLIGTMARQAAEQGHDVVMVTGDKDFMQLVSSKIIIWDPMKEKTIDEKCIADTHGLSAGQLVDMMALVGDSSDNVPGVPGIGPKTAATLIGRFSDIEGVYDAIDSISQKKQRENLIQFRDQAFLSRELVRIDTQSPVQFEAALCRLKKPDREKLTRLFKELEFAELQSRYIEKQEEIACEYHVVSDMAALKSLIEALAASGVFAFDTETTALDPMQARLVGISFSMRPGQAYYIACGHDYLGVPEQLPTVEVLDALRPILESAKLKKVGQNTKYDAIVLARYGVRVQGVVFDTMVASYLINPSKRAHNLEQIALDFLGRNTTVYSDVAGKGKNAVCFSKVPLSKAAPYACEDADVTFAAYVVLKNKLEELGLFDLFEQVEMPLIPVLMKMEMTGAGIDRRRLRDLSENFADQLSALEADIYKAAGEHFNINSSQQLGTILFEKLRLPVQKKTKKKTGYSTDVDVLCTLAEHHELPALILRHRALAKLKSTYSDAILDLIHPETGRIHTSYNQTVTATGRLSSSDPNLQNIPIRTEEGREIRKAFVPEKGWLFVSADYSQIELRILAHCSEDPILLEAFEKDEDVHLRTAAEVFRVDRSLISQELRRQAKVINFGIIYGMSPFGLSKELGISQQMAKTYIASYFDRYKGVKAFIEHAIENARKNKMSSTLLGRIRLLPEIDSTNNIVRQFAERMAVNTPIQGTAADFIKLAMIRVDASLAEAGMKARMILSVHDELVFEVPPEEANETQRLVRNEMESVWALRVPLKVNIQSGDNWSEAH